ncbi:MAG TPA: T9SS type A sorting domain-containing protein [Bacteroidales bacterium]|nr:T9SS type A sorting domain-containing protein [Bacteroidales bacterium]
MIRVICLIVLWISSATCFLLSSTTILFQGFGAVQAQNPESPVVHPKSAFVYLGQIPEGVTCTTVPNPMGNSIGRPGGFRINYNFTGWPQNTYWGLDEVQSVLNLNNNLPPNQNCSFLNLTYDASNAETNLSQGKICFTGQQSYYCLNTSQQWINKTCNVRMRVVVTYTNLSTPVPLSLQSGIITGVPSASFVVRVYMEVLTSNLDNVVWVGTNYYNYGGWYGVIDVYNALATNPSRSICTTFDTQSFYYGNLSAEVEPEANPGGTSITIIPGSGSNALGTAVGLQVIYNNANWPECINWGLYKNQAVLNLNNTQPPNYGCNFLTLVFDPINTETNLVNGKMCFTGVQSYYCLNASGQWISKSVHVRMRVIVTKSNGTTPIPLGFVDDYILMHVKENFIAKVYIEANASELDNLLWTGTNYYSLGGWRGVTDIYNSLHTYMNYSICTQFNTNNFLSFNTVVSASSNSPIHLGNTLEFTGYSSMDCCYHWSGPNNYTSEEQNPIINNTVIQNFGNYELFITDNIVCYGYDEIVTMVLPSVSVSPEDGEVCQGGSFLLTATAVGTGYTFTYQWYYFINGVWKIAPGFTQSTLNTNAPYTRQYRVKAIGNNGLGTVTVTSDPVTVTVYPDPAITLQPLNRNICTGGTHTMTITATGGITGLNYQWQESAEESNWTNLAEETSNSLTISNATLTRYYRCVVSAEGPGCNTVISNSALLTIYNDPQILINGNYEFCAGESAFLIATAVTGGCGVRSYQWQYYDDGFWRDMDGETNYKITVYPSVTTQYRLALSTHGNGCNTAYSTPVTVTVHPDPYITTQPEGGTILAPGEEFPIAVVADGGMGLLYQWQYFMNGIWIDIPGANSPEFVTQAPYTRSYRVKISSNGAGCDYVYSNIATITLGGEKDNFQENDPGSLFSMLLPPEVLIFPNPFSDYIIIALSNLPCNEKLRIEVFDLYGRKITEIAENQVSDTYNKNLSLSGLTPAMYFVRITSGKNVLIKKIEKR